MTLENDHADMKKSHKHVIMTGIGMFVTSGLCYWALQRMDIDTLRVVLSDVHLGWFGCGVLAIFASIAVQAFRWWLALPSSGKPSFGTLFHATVISSFFNNLLPALIGGDIYRGTRVAREVGVKETVQSLIVVRITNLWGAALLPMVFVAPHVELLMPTLWFRPLMLCSIAAWAGLFVVTISIQVLVRNEARWAEFRIAPLLRLLVHVTQDTRSFLTLMLSSWAFQATTITSFYCFMQSLELELPISTLGLLVPSILILTTLPFSFNGLGVRESAFMITLASWGISSERSFALSIVAYAGLLVTGLLGGILFVEHILRTRLFAPDSSS